MPGGPDYPHDESHRYPLSRRDDVAFFKPSAATQGIVLDGGGDVRNWVTSSGVTAAQRDLVTALAYLDVADAASEDRHQDVTRLLVAILDRLVDLRNRVDAQADLLTQIAGVIGVVVPGWLTLTEVEEGDEMGGIARPSAAALGLEAEIIHRQLEPGFDHEQVVSIDPAAGSLVVRGSQVRVTISLHG